VPPSKDAAAEADDFDYYSLGTSFEGLKLAGKGRQCEPPPKKLRDPSGRLVYMNPARTNTVFYVYGSCKPPRDPETGLATEGGCTPPLSVNSSPACEQPHSLYARYAAGGSPVPHQHLRVRGAPAAIFGGRPRDDVTRIELYAGDARVLIAGRDAETVRRAAAQIAAPRTSRGGAREASAVLPNAIRGAAEDTATENPRC